MSRNYIENSSSGSQYYFNANNAATTTTSQSYQPYVSSGYSTYPTNLTATRLPNQQIRLDTTFQAPQQYQSVAGFNKNVTQQFYQSPQSPSPHLRATVRAISSQDQYNIQRSSPSIQVSPQHHHFQFDNHHQPGRPTGPAVVYQTPGAAQFTHRNVDLWTEGPSQGSDHYAQRVSVRPVSTGSPQQSHSVSPQRHQDHLQQYYSQLTPEQHQQLLRQQQLQRQQEQNSHYEQQQRVTVQQISPSTQHRSTAGFSGGQQQQQQHQQGRSRSESERQRQDEQDYYGAQRQMAAQRVQQQQQQQQQPQYQEEQSSHPVGIRNLMNRFAVPASGQQFHPRSRSTTSRQYSSSSYTTNSGPSKTTTRTLTSHSMTYSALPQNREPPVNSLEYYQMQQQSGSPFTNIQQAAAPAHIQHVSSPTGFGALRDRFKTGSLSDDFQRPPQAMNRQPPPPQQQQQYQQPNPVGSSLSSIRNQYMNLAKQSSLDEFAPQPVQNISRTIVGEDIPQQKPAPSVQQQPPAPVLQAPQPQQQQQQQQPAPVSEAPQQEQTETPSEAVDQQAPSTEVASSPPPTATTTTDDTTTAAEGVSSF